MSNTYDFEAIIPTIAALQVPQNSDDEDSGGNRNGSKHELVCRHWLRGICTKEWKCDFLHICDDSRMPFCRSQRRHGRCAEQVLGLCNLRHSAEDATEEVGAQDPLFGSTAASNANSATNADICFRYLYGYCPLGPMCQLKHVKLSRHPQYPLPDWYLTLLLNAEPPLGIQDDVRRKAAGQWIQFALENVENLNPRDPVFEALQNLQPLPSLLPPTTSPQLSGIRCFILKSGKIENILTSVQKGIWATGRGNIPRLTEAFATCQHVILLMSANESGGFQGYCRMASSFDPTLYPGVWGTFSNKLSANFRLQWIKQTKLDFQTVSTYTNPLNGNLPLKKSRDGQELPYELTEIICNILNHLPHHDLLSGTPLQNLPKIDHQTFFQLTPQLQVQKEVALGLRPKPLQQAARPAPLLTMQQQQQSPLRGTPPAAGAAAAAAVEMQIPGGPQHPPRPPMHDPNRWSRGGSSRGGGSGGGSGRKRQRESVRPPSTGSASGRAPPDGNPYLRMVEQMRRRR